MGYCDTKILEENDHPGGFEDSPYELATQCFIKMGIWKPGKGVMYTPTLGYEYTPGDGYSYTIGVGTNKVVKEKMIF